MPILLTMPKPHSQKSGNTPTPKFNNGRDIPSAPDDKFLASPDTASDTENHPALRWNARTASVKGVVGSRNGRTITSSGVFPRS